VAGFGAPTASPSVTIDRSLISSNGYGIYMNGPSGSSFAVIHVSDSTITENTVAGVYCTGTETYFSATRTTIVRNHVGIHLANQAPATLDGNYIEQNEAYGLVTETGTVVFTRGNNTIFSKSVMGQISPVSGD
jgi:hypothetical protein